jgi:hypothetical protein
MDTVIEETTQIPVEEASPTVQIAKSHRRNSPSGATLEKSSSQIDIEKTITHWKKVEVNFYRRELANRIKLHVDCEKDLREFHRIIVDRAIKRFEAKFVQNLGKLPVERFAKEKRLLKDFLRLEFLKQLTDWEEMNFSFEQIADETTREEGFEPILLEEVMHKHLASEKAAFLQSVENIIHRSTFNRMRREFTDRLVHHYECSYEVSTDCEEEYRTLCCNSIDPVTDELEVEWERMEANNKDSVDEIRPQPQTAAAVETSPPKEQNMLLVKIANDGNTGSEGLPHLPAMRRYDCEFLLLAKLDPVALEIGSCLMEMMKGDNIKKNRHVRDRLRRSRVHKKNTDTSKREMNSNASLSQFQFEAIAQNLSTKQEAIAEYVTTEKTKFMDSVKNVISFSSFRTMKIDFSLKLEVFYRKHSPYLLENYSKVVKEVEVKWMQEEPKDFSIREILKIVDMEGMYKKRMDELMKRNKLCQNELTEDLLIAYHNRASSLVIHEAGIRIKVTPKHEKRLRAFLDIVFVKYKVCNEAIKTQRVRNKALQSYLQHAAQVKQQKFSDEARMQFELIEAEKRIAEKYKNFKRLNLCSPSEELEW